MLELVEPPIRVSVIPPTPAFNDNALFECRRQDTGSHSPNTHWADCFAEVHKIGASSNVLFCTADVMSMEDCDVVMYIAQPDSPKDVLRHKQKHPTQKAILVMSETSLGARYFSNPKNHVGFDAIFTYVEPLVDNKRYFFFPQRAFYRHRIVEGLPFEQRRLGCLVGTNRRMSYRIGVFTMRKGWRFSLRDWLDYVFCPGELITYRSELGKACAAYQDRFDVFGEGWDLVPEMRGVCRGVPKASTLSYVGRYRFYFALENHTSACALISERVWDALWGGSVPVYLGHTGIDRFIPRECYIDARYFKHPAQLLQTLHDMPESTWKKYRLAGREFIRSAAVERYLPGSFAEEFVRRVTEVASGKHKGMVV